ncbi:MAG TPA: peptide-methionine (S)-S-oxide reductase MsrA [Spirochaetia bacterium]|nr:peptide-methionine (S)-S-oxide reductase MsrA [Spirochaetia bacterium]
MKSTYSKLRAFAIVTLVTTLAAGCAATSAHALNNFPDPPAEPTAMQANGTATTLQKAVFSGGCFWGVQGVFERLKGVESTFTGYSGGSAATAQYEIVSTGTTGHAESVELTYDPSVISYGTLLKVFFSVVQNPTELNYQGPDHGTQYRSVIFYMNDQQKELAQAYIKKLDAAKTFSSPIVTQVVPFKAFYNAEEYHQHFMDNNPYYPYIVYWDWPKVKALEKLYPNLVVERYLTSDAKMPG